MHISLEAADHHAIQSYNEQQLQINSIVYKHSLIVSRQEIISDLTIKNLAELDEHYLNLLIKHKPELIIIGHKTPGAFPPPTLLATLSQQRIGVECMSIGADVEPIISCSANNVQLSLYL